VALPSGESFSVNLQAGAAITLEELVAIATDPQVAQNTLQTLIDSHAAMKATTSLSSHVELATAAEAQAGTDTERAVTPAGLPLFKKLGPYGLGMALLAALAGNQRGDYAVDFQTLRANVNQIAKGYASAILAGYNNRADGDMSVVVSGNDNLIEYSTGGAIIGGQLNTISQADEATIINGSNNSISGSAVGAAIINSEGGVIIKPNAIIIGGQYGKADKRGQFINPGGKFAVVGDAQGSRYVMRRQITHNSTAWTLLLLDNIDQLTVPTNSVWSFVAYITGATSGCAKSFGFKIEGVIKNIAGTVTLLASTVMILYNGDDVSFSARAVAYNGTYKTLQFEVNDSDAAGDTVRWVANIETTEVIYS
jgi:hypothetical protein